MKAVAYFESLAIDDPRALQDVELPEPVPGPRDLLVEVRAISVNPVDTKVRRNTQPEGGQPKVLGWDVAGVVVGVGSEVSCSRSATRCSTQAPSPAPAATANAIWWTSASSGASRGA